MKQITVNFVISIDEKTQKFLGTFTDGLFRPHWPAPAEAAGAAGDPEKAEAPAKDEPAPAPVKEEAPAPEPEKPAPKKAPARKAAAKKKDEPAPADPRQAAAANLAAIEAAAVKDEPAPAPAEAPAPAMPDAGTREYQELLQKVGKLGAAVAVKDKDGAIARMTEVIGVPRLDKADYAQLQTLLGIFEEMSKEAG